MKKFLPFFTIAAVVMFMSSCTHEYICQCVVKYSGHPPSLPDSAVHEFTIRNTKKVAAQECEDNSVNTTNNGVTMNETCQLY